ncbi:T9SS type A sorting domain-containing protein [Aequorivita sp. SDUM287046]|uniref:T9SS type A sorting domain-containing protein n=1 Tax=Aequorivita aurantiaca TaxID=3053356 RepID=A0ABT8DKV8_9FLAO|nr:T9SS type A sorting domain-containing protein [Aequorivita aurantiaca]MDN3724540.1 T9SS type A sorting domain-containing protein [Aequorivita aurantiaca]
MKLKLLFLTILGSVSIANAQYTVRDINGVELKNGDILEFTEFGYGTSANYEFFVTNDNPSEEIHTRIEYIGAVNTDGSMLEICYANQCYIGFTPGATIPTAPEVFTIAVGETTGEGNHFLNGDGGNGVDIIEYTCAFHQYEADGVTEIGTPLTFTYRYNPGLIGVNENSKVNLTIQSTLISNEMVLNVKEPVSMLVYNLQGGVVKQARFEAGVQTVNMSDLSAQTYIVKFNNEKGATQTTKIIVQ